MLKHVNVRHRDTTFGHSTRACTGLDSARPSTFHQIIEHVSQYIHVTVMLWNEKLSCRRETEWCFMSLNSSLSHSSHSRSLKMVDRPQYTTYCQSVTVTIALILCHSRDNARHRPKIVIFFYLLPSTPPLGGPHRNIAMPFGMKKMVWLPDGETNLMICYCLAVSI